MVKVLRELALMLFHAWRRLLTAIVRTVTRMWARLRRAGERWGADWRTAYMYLRHTDVAWADERPDRLMVAAMFGLRAFIAGLLISSGIALGTGSRAWTAILMASSELLWAGARAAIVLLLMPTEPPRSRVLIAFAAGLAPYALGVTPLLQFIALWPSALLTARGLRGAGVAPASVRTATRWAFGGQAAIIASGLAARSVIALFGIV